MPDVIEVGQALDRQLATTPMSAGEEYRLRARIERELDRKARGRVGTGGLAMAGVVLVLAVAWMFASAGPVQPASEGPLREHADAERAANACVTSQHAAKVRIVGACEHRLDDLGVEIQTERGVVVERTRFGVHMHEGRATFVVSPRPEDAPAVVVVSHGRIEVIGTRFTVEQGPEGGAVELLEGRIRFRHSDGALAELMPGDSLSWGSHVSVELGEHDAVPDEPPSTADEPGSTSRARPSTTQRPDAPPDESETATTLDPWWASSPPEHLLDDLGDTEAPTTEPYGRWATQRAKDEELSYEQGLILDARGDRERACHHWRRHMFNYFPGRYARRAKKKERAACKQARGDAP